MKHWINKNYKTLIITAFLIPIITVAIVSISHVTQWYGISNPITWSIYLSIGIEIAALSALAAISANMGKKVYFPFAIVTLIQFIGNIFFAYSYINIGSESFKMWVELVSPLLEFMGVEPTDYVGHKRFLSLFAGGMLPIISLSFLHMLVKFTEEDRLKEEQNEGIDVIIDDGGISEHIKKEDTKDNPEDLRNFVDEAVRVHFTENDLKKLEQVLMNPPKPNEKLKEAAKEYSEKVNEIEDDILDEEIESIISTNEVKQTPKSIFPEEIEYSEEYNKPVYPTKEEQKQILSDMMQKDEELGLYDEPFDNPSIKQEVLPALSDEEVREMFMDEWERKFEMIEDDEETNDTQEQINEDKVETTVNNQITDAVTIVQPNEEFSNIEPTIEEENKNFSTITVNIENIFQNNEEQKVTESNSVVESQLEDEDDDMILKMRDIFLNDNIEEEKKNLIEEPQISTSSLVDSEENLYWEKDDAIVEEVSDLENTTIQSESENEIIVTPTPQEQEPIEVTRKVFSRNVNNTRRRNFR